MGGKVSVPFCLEAPLFHQFIFSARYLSSWFILDVASTVPFSAIMAIFTHKYETGFATSLINLLRLWRLRRVSAVFARYLKGMKHLITTCRTYSFFYFDFIILVSFGEWHHAYTP